MKAQPEPVLKVTEEIASKVAEWRQLADWLETSKKREMELRRFLADAFIPENARKEGVNRLVLEGMEIQIDHKISRKLDIDRLDEVMAELPEESPFRQVGVLIDYKPSLVLKGYRAMPDDERKIFQQALTEEPGAPSLTINVFSDMAPLDPATAPVTEDWPAKVSAVKPTKKPAKKAKK